MGRLLVSALLLVGLAGEARAQVNDTAAAEALFAEGRRLMKAKSYAAAAEKFAASDKADPSVGARLSMGDCYAAIGKTASAWSSYKSAANLARQKQDSRRARIAGNKAKRISSRLTYLVVAVPERVDGMVVTVAGKPVSSALFGVRVPVDPGTLEIAASAPGRQPFSERVKTDKAGAAVTVTVELVTVEPDKPDKPDKPDVKPDRPDNKPDVKPDVEPEPDPRVDTGPGDPGSGRRLLGLGVGAAGVVALGVGIGFGVSASSQWNSAFDDGLCDEDTNVCTPEGQEQTDTARSRATISTIAVASGLALVGAGVVLYLTAPKADSGEPSAQLAPVIGDGELGVALSGSF